MKVVILAGGLGTRISEESHLKPKPMIDIGGKPILWHIMKTYSHYGFNDFIICAGYKGYIIKEYFYNYFIHNSDLTIDLISGNVTHIHKSGSEPWKVTVVDTGLNTMTGGRIKRIREYIDGPFMMTYGDGVSNVNISELVSFHEAHGKIGTLTATKPDGRFGTLDLDNDRINDFREKKRTDVGWVNGGFMVLNPDIFDYLQDDSTVFENEPLESISREAELMAFKHSGFWQPMDTQRDKKHLEDLWNNDRAPWKIW
jgi:glucose-1-phosphate cytidylyltransferase